MPLVTIYLELPLGEYYYRIQPYSRCGRQKQKFLIKRNFILFVISCKCHTSCDILNTHK